MSPNIVFIEKDQNGTGCLWDGKCYVTLKRNFIFWRVLCIRHRIRQKVLDGPFNLLL